MENSPEFGNSLVDSRADTHHTEKYNSVTLSRHELVNIRQELIKYNAA